MFNIRKRLKERRKFKETVKELNSLTDKELADIGISRCDIKAVALGHVY